jgi:hypothetical protein
LAFATSPGGTPTEKMRITSSGNVGIGTTSPDAKLHTYGNVNSNIIDNVQNINTGANADAEVKVTNGSLVSYLGTYSFGGYGWVGSQSNNAFYFVTNNFVQGGFTAGGRLFLTPKGSIDGSSLYSYIASGVNVFRTDSGTVGTVIGSDSATFGWAGTSTNHAFHLTTNNTIKASIDTSGNFGINTTSPGKKLHVAGDVRLDVDFQSSLGSASKTQSGWARINIKGTDYWVPLYAYP